MIHKLLSLTYLVVLHTYHVHPLSYCPRQHISKWPSMQVTKLWVTYYAVDYFWPLKFFVSCTLNKEYVSANHAITSTKNLTWHKCKDQPGEDHAPWLTCDPWHHLTACSCSRAEWVPVSLNDCTQLNHIGMAHWGPCLQLLLTQTSLLHSKLPPSMVDVSYHTIATSANGLSHGFLRRQWDIGTFSEDVVHLLHQGEAERYTDTREDIAMQ